MSTKQQLVQALMSTYAKSKDDIFIDLQAHDFYNDADFFKWERQDGKEDMTDEEIIRGHIDERFWDFISDFKRVAKEHNGKLLIYRCMTVDDEGEFLFHIANGTPLEDYEGLGIFWAWDEGRAECHWGYTKGGHQLTVHALTALKSIDVYLTLLRNLDPSLGKDEAEIRLLEGASLEVLGVETKDGYVSPLDEGHKPIPLVASVASELLAFIGNTGHGGYDISTDNSFDRPGQLMDVGIPHQPFQLKEGLLNRPYYLGREERFMPDPAKYPNIRKVMEEGIKLKPQFVPTAPVVSDEPVMQVKPEIEKPKPEYPAVDKFLKKEEE